MLTLSRETRDALAREAHARDAATGAALLRRALVRAGAKLGAVLSVTMLGLMFGFAALNSDGSSYLMNSRTATLQVGGPDPLGSVLTLGLLWLGLVILGVGVIRSPRTEASHPNGAASAAASALTLDTADVTDFADFADFLERTELGIAR